MQVEIGKLRPGKNARVFFEDITELAERIRTSGWVSELLITEDGEIIAGERRWRACCYLNDVARRKGEKPPWTKLPCQVKDLDEKEVFDLNVAENAARQELRFIEWCRIFQNYRNEYGYSDPEIASRTGYDAQTVGKYISVIEKLHPDIVKRLDNGEKIPVNLLLKIYSIRNKSVHLVRLEQWYGNPTQTAAEPKSRERRSSLSRKKLLALLKVLEQKQAQPETLEVVRYIAGMRETLPHKWHLLLGPKKHLLQRD